MTKMTHTIATIKLDNNEQSTGRIDFDNGILVCTDLSDNDTWFLADGQLFISIDDARDYLEQAYSDAFWELDLA